MKKLLLTLALVFGMVATASAEINLGGRAAINFGTLTGDAEDAPWGFGFNAGLASKFGINDMFAVAPEVGINLHRSSDAVSTWSTWSIDIPVLARINVMPALYLELGPQFSILLSSVCETDMIITTVEWDFGDMEILNTLEIGLAAGVGYTVKPNLDVNFRMNLGFTSIIDGDKEPKMSADDGDDIFSAMGTAATGASFGGYEEEEDSIEMNAFGESIKRLQFQVGVTYWFM